MVLPEPLPPREDEVELASMSLFEHLEELRRRILRSLVVLGLGFVICFAFAKQIYSFLEMPISPYVESLSFLRVTDPFMVYVKVAMVASIFLSSPWLMLELWGFVSPGLYGREKRWALPFILSSSGFFIAGGTFGFYIAWPFAIKFLLGLGENFNAVITVQEYFNQLIVVLLGLGFMFQLPVVIFLLALLGIVTPRLLIQKFRCRDGVGYFASAARRARSRRRLASTKRQNTASRTPLEPATFSQSRLDEHTDREHGTSRRRRDLPARARPLGQVQQTRGLRSAAKVGPLCRWWVT